MPTVSTARYDDAFALPVGYHAPCNITRLDNGGYRVDRTIPDVLHHFLGVVTALADEAQLPQPGGVGYLRIVDASTTFRQLWHIDNDDGGVRFTTAVATDGHPVNMAFLDDHDRVGCPVDPADSHSQHRDGTVRMFRREPHGALPAPPRPGALTAVFFATLYPSAADLWTNNCGNGPVHQALPALAV